MCVVLILCVLCFLYVSFFSSSSSSSSYYYFSSVFVVILILFVPYESHDHRHDMPLLCVIILIILFIYTCLLSTIILYMR